MEARPDLVVAEKVRHPEMPQRTVAVAGRPLDAACLQELENAGIASLEVKAKPTGWSGWFK